MIDYRRKVASTLHLWQDGPWPARSGAIYGTWHKGSFEMNKSTLFGMLAIVGAFAVGAWACGDDEDDGGNEGAGGTEENGTGGNEPGGGTCDECTADKCADEKAACDEDCTAYGNCIKDCAEDPDCLLPCATDHATGGLAWASLNACQVQKCLQECNTP